MNRDLPSLCLVLGAGFASISSTLAHLTVYNGPDGLMASLPMIVAGLVVLFDYLDDRDDTGLTDQEIRDLGGDPDA